MNKNTTGSFTTLILVSLMVWWFFNFGLAVSMCFVGSIVIFCWPCFEKHQMSKEIRQYVGGVFLVVSCLCSFIIIYYGYYRKPNSYREKAWQRMHTESYLSAEMAVKADETMASILEMQQKSKTKTKKVFTKVVIAGRKQLVEVLNNTPLIGVEIFDRAKDKVVEYLSTKAKTRKPVRMDENKVKKVAKKSLFSFFHQDPKDLDAQAKIMGLGSVETKLFKSDITLEIAKQVQDEVVSDFILPAWICGLIGLFFAIGYYPLPARIAEKSDQTDNATEDQINKFNNSLDCCTYCGKKLESQNDICSFCGRLPQAFIRHCPNCLVAVGLTDNACSVCGKDTMPNMKHLKCGDCGVEVEIDDFFALRNLPFLFQTDIGVKLYALFILYGYKNSEEFSLFYKDYCSASNKSIEEDGTPWGFKNETKLLFFVNSFGCHKCGAKHWRLISKIDQVREKVLPEIKKAFSAAGKGIASVGSTIVELFGAGADVAVEKVKENKKKKQKQEAEKKAKLQKNSK